MGNKKAKAEEWCGAELHEVSKWARGGTNTIYAANFPGGMHRFGLTDLVEDEFAPGRGWFPLALPEFFINLLKGISDYGFDRDLTVFDGFMGRGTVGKACRNHGQNFVGIDRNPARVAIAREYLGC